MENPEAHAASWSGLPDYSSATTGSQRADDAGDAGLSLAAEAGAHARARRRRRRRCRAAAADDARGRRRRGDAAADAAAARRRAARRSSPASARCWRSPVSAAISGWRRSRRRQELDAGDGRAAAASDAAPQATPPEEMAPTPSPAPSDEVIVTVTSDPSGAKVYRADKSDAETQPTPITFKLHRGDPPFDVQLRLEGYAAADAYHHQRRIGQAAGVAGEVSRRWRPVAARPKRPAGRAQGDPPTPHGGADRAEAAHVAEATTRHTETARPSRPSRPKTAHHRSRTECISAGSCISRHLTLNNLALRVTLKRSTYMPRV